MLLEAITIDGRHLRVSRRLRVGGGRTAAMAPTLESWTAAELGVVSLSPALVGTLLVWSRLVALRVPLRKVNHLPDGLD